MQKYWVYIVCNKYIKFGKMLDIEKQYGYQKIATGHYAQIKKTENGRYLLLKAEDTSKDQTYVLYCLTQEQLAEKLDVSRQAVAKWENGETYPDIDNLISLSDIFNITLDRLLKEDNLSKYACKDSDAVRLKEYKGDIRPNYFRDIDRIIHSLSYFNKS